MFRALCLSLALLGLAAAPALAEPVRTENVETELHSARASIAPGERFTVVLRQNIRENWHTYWINPGDSGEASELEWTPAPGFEIGPIQWPAPEPIPFAILVNYGYSNEVLFPIEITAPASLRPGDTAQLSANAYWLVCSDVCIPEEGVLTLSLPVTAQGADDPEWAPRVAAAVAGLPQPSDIQARITAGAPARLSLALPNAQNIRNPYFFPFSRDAINHAAPQGPAVGAGGLSFALEPGVAENLGRTALAGVVAYEVEEGGAWVRRAIEIEAQPGALIAETGDTPAVMTAGHGGGEGGAADGQALAGPPVSLVGVLGLMAFAFLGGLILNVMPCVLPVLSIKALSLAGGAHAGEARRHGLLYLGGVLATFAALAILLIALRSAGAAVGWGFQLQEPWLVAALALLFFAIGLNLLGVFEIGGGVQDAGASLASRGGDAGAFFTGALAVVAATPCTAPFMAGATGVALTQSPPVVLAVFLALALGFAAPFVALAFAPGLQKLIPKPGPWMDRFKQVLAFPMFAAAALLAWVLAEQTGSSGALALLCLVTALAFFLVVMKWGRVWLGIGAAAVLLTLVFAWRPLIGAEPSAAQAARSLQSEPWSAARLAEIRAEGRPVFVNFTAAWCVSCKVNEAVALSRPRVAEAMAAENIAYLVGDWTNRDEEIAAELAAHGRAGVPLYLYYPAGADEPIILPQLLTESMILDAVSPEGEQS